MGHGMHRLVWTTDHTDLVSTTDHTDLFRPRITTDLFRPRITQSTRIREPLLVRLLDQREIRLADQFSTEIDDGVARALDVDRAADQVHEAGAQGHEIGGDVGILVAERARMNAGDEEAGQLEE